MLDWISKTEKHSANMEEAFSCEVPSLTSKMHRLQSGTHMIIIDWLSELCKWMPEVLSDPSKYRAEIWEMLAISALLVDW